jgi:glycosyltransferase involved in cell wall biosynthesis
LPPLEAMACGAPVIAGGIPALQETLGNAAQLVEPLDVEALAESIVDLLQDDGRRNMLGSEGRQRAAEFSWERTARLTLDVYQNLLRTAGRPKDHI